MPVSISAEGGANIAEMGLAPGDEFTFELEVRFRNSGLVGLQWGMRPSIGFKGADLLQTGQLVGGGTQANDNEWVKIVAIWTIPAGSVWINVGAANMPVLPAGTITECREPRLYKGTATEATPNDFIELGKYGGNRGGQPTSSGPRTVPTAASVVAPNGQPYSPAYTPTNLMPPETPLSSIYSSEPMPSEFRFDLGAPFNWSAKDWYEGQRQPKDYRFKGGYFPAPSFVADWTDPNSTPLGYDEVPPLL